MSGRKEIVIGPYHEYLLEPERIKLVVEDDTVKDVDITLGYCHRSIEKLMTTRTYKQAVFLSERICGICSHAHTTAYCTTAEAVLEVDTPERGLYIRTVVAEIERLHSHFLWLALLAHAVGEHEAFAHIMTEREKVMDLLELISGNRVHYAINTVGGVRRDITPKVADKIMETMREIRPLAEYCVNMLDEYGPVGRKVAGIGVMSYDDAIRLGAVGPTLRGSGVRSDVRADDPYAAYGELSFEVVVEKDGDVRARSMVRARENLESISIIEQAVGALPQGQIAAELGEPTVGEFVGRGEAPRGELVYYIRANGTHIPERVKVRTPTYANVFTYTKTLLGAKLEHVRPILESIDPCYACTDRLTIVDAKTGKQRTLSVADLPFGTVDGR